MRLEEFTSLRGLEEGHFTRVFCKIARSAHSSALPTRLALLKDCTSNALGIQLAIYLMLPTKLYIVCVRSISRGLYLLTLFTRVQHS